MGLFDFLRRAGSPKDQPSAAPVEYKGYRIRSEPRRQGSQWLVAGVISKEFPDGVKEHQFVRADTFASRDDAQTLAIDKAKRIVDETGDRMFERG